MAKPDRCYLCNRVLSIPEEPMSSDCGGDCWGCLGFIEADGGYPPSVEQVAKEIKQGWRNADGTAKYST